MKYLSILILPILISCGQNINNSSNEETKKFNGFTDSYIDGLKDIQLNIDKKATDRYQLFHVETVPINADHSAMVALVGRVVKQRDKIEKIKFELRYETTQGLAYYFKNMSVKFHMLELPNCGDFNSYFEITADTIHNMPSTNQLILEDSCLVNMSIHEVHKSDVSFNKTDPNPCNKDKDGVSDPKICKLIFM